MGFASRIANSHQPISNTICLGGPHVYFGHFLVACHLLLVTQSPRERPAKILGLVRHHRCAHALHALFPVFHCCRASYIHHLCLVQKKNQSKKSPTVRHHCGRNVCTVAAFISSPEPTGVRSVLDSRNGSLGDSVHRLENDIWWAKCFPPPFNFDNSGMYCLAYLLLA